MLRFSVVSGITGKGWGLALFAALALLFANGSAALLPIAIVCGLLSHLENLAITAVLPAWRHDVPSVVNAWRLRRVDPAPEEVSSPRPGRAPAPVVSAKIFLWPKLAKQWK